MLVFFQPPRYHKTKYSANPPVEHHVGWVFGTRPENQGRYANGTIHCHKVFVGCW